MIRLIAALGTAALVIWVASDPTQLDLWPESVQKLGLRAADLWSAVEPAPGETRSHALVTPSAEGAAEPPALPGASAPGPRREFTPDLGADGALPGGTGTADAEPGAPRAPARLAGLSRAEADEIRYRLDRVMSLASGDAR